MKKVVVDCEKNDLVDVKCGGPQYLGFDFYVDDFDDEEIENFIRRTLKKYGHNCIGITVKEVSVPKVWTAQEIEDCIKSTRF